MESKFNEIGKKFKSLYFLFPVALFSVIWCYVLIVEMNSFNIGIFDYGVAYNMLWREAFGVASYPSSAGYLPYFEPIKMISFLLIPYMLLFPSIYNLLILQVIVFAVPAVILYFLSMRLTKSKKISLIVDIVWLLYYPNSAAINYPFHYQTLFPLFYLLGFLLLYLKKVKIASASFAISALTNLLAPFILILTIPTIYLLNLEMKKHNEGFNKRSLLLLSSIVLSVSIFILVFNLLMGGTSIYTGQVIPRTSSSANLPLLDALWTKFVNVSGYYGFLYILFMVFPLAFSLLIEWRFIIPAIPAMAYYLVGYSGGYLRFFYPMQYSVWLSPIVFLSFVLFIKHLQDSNFDSKIVKGKSSILINKIKSRKRSVILAILTSVLIINAVLFSLYSPIGPLNEFLKEYPNAAPPSNGGYGLYENFGVTNYDTNLLKLESFVPANATVLSQFNMPQFSNRYYFTYPGQYNPAYPIDYAINDPLSFYAFTTPVYDTNPYYNYNMMELSNMMLMNSSYGVYGQSMGAILFKLGYKGMPDFFVPLNYELLTNKINNNGFSTPSGLFSPGTYDISLNYPGSSSVSLYFGSTLISIFNNTNKINTIQIPQYVCSSFTAVGNISSLTIQITQTAPAVHINPSKSVPQLSVYPPFISNYSNSLLRNIDSFNPYGLSAHDPPKLSKILNASLGIYREIFFIKAAVKPSTVIR
ncbi:MAG: hypothetical protein AMDU2_EPLC00011G0002 [Thermoplasmatales archaeon E-plasma]|nr:MAG: hypothetical protein AMDU2_EPLC00011G0002 [Thermoplasmatales archaeon E-plasma]